MAHNSHTPSPHAAESAQAGNRNGFFLAFSPEREDPGNVEFSTRTIPKLVGGVDADEAPTPSPRRRYPA